MLINARKDTGLTQTEVAQRVEQRQNLRFKMLIGRARLNVAEYIEISRAIGAGPYMLMGEAEGGRARRKEEI